LAKSLTEKSFFNHNQAPGQVCGRLPQGSLKGEGVGTTESNDTDETKGRKAQGYAWASQAGAVFSNPFASELARDSEIPSLICSANGPALSLRAEIVGRKCGVALGLQAGMCCEKASVSALASVFSATDPAFAQRIEHF
jgi:hypothetical protein